MAAGTGGAGAARTVEPHYEANVLAIESLYVSSHQDFIVTRLHGYGKYPAPEVISLE